MDPNKSLDAHHEFMRDRWEQERIDREEFDTETQRLFTVWCGRAVVWIREGHITEKEACTALRCGPAKLYATGATS